MAYKIGDISPEFPMTRIVDTESDHDFDITRITVNGTIDGVRNWYYIEGIVA